jgi:hypothetical protein
VPIVPLLPLLPLLPPLIPLVPLVPVPVVAEKPAVPRGADGHLLLAVQYRTEAKRAHEEACKYELKAGIKPGDALDTDETNARHRKRARA